MRWEEEGGAEKNLQENLTWTSIVDWNFQCRQVARR